MNTIKHALESLDIPPDENLISSLETYVAEIIRWNNRINLTGASVSEEFIKGPLFDALTVLSVVEKMGSLVDVGSGSGLPGIPISLANPGLAVTLVEPRSKRASFLRHVVHHLGMDAEVLEAREEKLPSSKWRGAVAQAVWPPDVWIKRSLRLVEPGGAVYVLSSSPVAGSAMPTGAVFEEQHLCVRPLDNKKRYASRIRVEEH